MDLFKRTLQPVAQVLKDAVSTKRKGRESGAGGVLDDGWMSGCGGR